MNYKLKSRELLFLAAIAGIAFSGCTKDTAYDKLTEEDGIDLTVSIANGGLTIPLGSTDTIYATELIDPDDSENISLDEFGNYFLGTDGTLDPSSVSVDASTIDVPKVEFEAIPYVFQISNLTSDQMTTINGMTPMTPLTTLGTLTNPAITTPSTGDDIQAPDTLIILDASGVDAALIAISSLDFANQMKSVLSFTLSNLPNSAAAYDITVQNAKLKLPDFMVAQNTAGVEYVRDAQGWIAIPNITVNKPAGNTSATIQAEDIIISGMEFINSPLRNIGGNLHRETKIGIYSELAISNMTSLNGAEVIYLRKVGSTPYFGFTSGTTLGVTLETTSATMGTINGQFFPTIDPITTDVSIDLGDDMDFLQADDVVLDIENPRAIINLTNECQIGITAKAVFTSNKGNTIVFDNIWLTPDEGKTAKKIVFKAKPEAGDDPQNTYYNPAFSTFVQPIPDNITAQITAVADSANVYPFPLGSNINIAGDYAIEVPFDFNTLSFTYDETTEDVFDNMSDDDDKISETINEIKGAGITFKAISTIGLDLKLDVVATNLAGLEDPSLITVTPVTIQHGTVANPTTSDVSLIMDINDISKVRDLIFRLKGSANNSSLSSKQYVILKDVKVVLKNLELDLNDND